MKKIILGDLIYLKWYDWILLVLTSWILFLTMYLLWNIAWLISPWLVILFIIIYYISLANWIKWIQNIVNFRKVKLNE